MTTLTLWTVAKLALEITLGVSIKLLCDNGRIHWRDLVNDSVFSLPGFAPASGDGLTREIQASLPATAPAATTAAAAAAK